MPRTRSTKAGAADSNEPVTPVSSSKYVLTPSSGPPSKLFILPKKATPDARIVTLPNPRNGQPARYLVCPDTGIYEFTKIAAPSTTPRSWLVETHLASTETKKGAPDDIKAQVMMGAELYIATTIDPVFLVLPALVDSQVSKGSEEKKRLFLSSDDHFDKLPEESSHLSEILRWEKSRALIETRMSAICDTVEAGDESMFRLNESKLLATVLGKAKNMSAAGLPASMADKFVKRPLEAPVVLQKRSSPVNGTQLESADSQASTPLTDSAASQSTATTDAASSFTSQASTAATSFTEDGLAADTIMNTVEASAEVVELQSLRVAFDFICSSYVAPKVAEELREQLLKDESIDFAPLDKYLAKVAELRTEAFASRATTDFSRKRAFDEEEEEARQEKKRKLEEEKKRKASESRGVRDLKKVNTSGMKKLSHFFKAK
ncbi:ribonuclease H2, subunit B [Purpureocillium lavendulum]|uniref:Ribonuclease H2 subunit B n=1 Tax=Purpureocillium lavendulum TaxID=1247861 RepID=A0AB34FHI1_9HYPO|nr:ribonuclease H2, subunit B [Purpureocillium lavendulum]